MRTSAIAVAAATVLSAVPAAAQQAGSAQDTNAGVAARPGSVDATTSQNQETAPGGQAAATDEVVVTGLRGSLATAQSLKRNAIQQIDSISSQDVGKLPDNTVSDALQRVTGVQVLRGAGEAGTVLVRGLPNTATLINGREVFTGTGRGVALQDIPAELIAGVDVYKSSTPDIVEGGVAGVIDVRLRRPLDLPGLQVAATGRGVYSDQSSKWGYLGSGLVSDRWDTSIGEVGALVGVSYNRRRYQDNTAFDFVSNPLNGSPGIPDTVGGIYGNGQRTRKAINGALQWRPSASLEFYADAIYTTYDNRYNNDFFVGLPKPGNAADLTVNSTYADYPFLASATTARNAYTLTSQQAFEDHTRTVQADLGSKWQAGDHTTVVVEGVYNHSSLRGQNAIVDTSFNAPTARYDFDRGGTPLVGISGVDLTNPANFTLRTLFDNHSQSASTQWAGRGDLDRKFDGGFLADIKVGVRGTDRHVSSQATTSVPIAITNAVLASSVPGFAQLSPGGLVQGRAGLDRFVDANPDFLRSNTDQVRTIFSQPTGARAYDPANAFFDDETTYAGYVQAGFRFDLGGVRVDGTGGVRVVRTEENLTGNGVASKQSYTNALPSLNARLHFTDKLQFRFSVGKTITRPEFTQLNPLVAYASTGTTGNQGVAYTGAGGNPGLQPIKSTALDGSLEWYFTRSSSLTVAGFYRKLNGYIQSYAVVEPYIGATALVTRPRNTGNGSLRGAEAAYQQFFDFLPGALSGLGVQLNATYIDGTTQDPFTGRQERLVNVSRYSYNAVAIYEKHGISTRLAWNWRSPYVDSYNSGGVQASTIEARSIGQLDLSVNYELTKWLTLTFDATNLTDRRYQDRFKGVNAASQVYSNTPRDTRTYDRTFEFGARVKL